MSDQIELTRVPRILRERGIIASYSRIWRKIADGDLPAERIGARWFVSPDDLDLIARTLAER